jgi:Skp family chaperone for outer membrane proteins
MRFARMNGTRMVSTALLVAVAITGMTIIFDRPAAQAQTGVSKVAIANPVAIFSQLQQTKDLIAQMASDGKTLEANRIKRQGDITDLRQRRDTLKPDSPQWAQLNQDLLSKTIEFQNWFQFTQASIQQQQKLQIKMLYDKITITIAKVAVQRGVELVLAEQRPELPADLDQVNIDQLRGLLGQRNVLYNAESVDISNQVIAAMDADYKAGK